jgi:hypothetical protein
MEIVISARIGSNVIDISTVRKSEKERLLAGECAHQAMAMDPILSLISCLDCGAQLNPIEWFVSKSELFVEMRRQQLADYEAAEQKIKNLTQTECQHCGKITPILLNETGR